MSGSASTNTKALPTAAKRRKTDNLSPSFDTKADNGPTSKNDRLSIGNTGRQANATASVSISERMQPSVPMRIGGGRVKKARVLFDPSEDNFPRRRQTTGGSNSNDSPSPNKATSSTPTPSPPPTARIVQPTATTKLRQQAPLKRRFRKPSSASAATKGQPVKCQLCLQPIGAAAGDGSSKQSSGPPVSVCGRCSRSIVHTHCYRTLRPDVDADAEMVSWTCAACKTCTVCEKSFSNQHPIFICCQCNEPFHADCNLRNGQVVRPANKVPHDRFCCAQCEDKAVTTAVNADQGSTRVTANTYTNADQVSTVVSATKAATKATKAAPRRVRVSGFLGFAAAEIQRPSKNGQQQPEHVAEPIVPQQNDPQPEADSEPAIVVKDEPQSPTPTVEYVNIEVENQADDASDNGDDNLPDNTLPSPEPSFSLVAARTDDHFAIRSTFEPLIPGEFNGYVGGWSPYGACASDIVPDVTNWTIDNVHGYFNKCVPTVAEAMKHHEIDGAVLKLLQRRDVLSLPGVSMGASINAYLHVRRLQTRSNDIRNAF